MRTRSVRTAIVAVAAAALALVPTTGAAVAAPGAPAPAVDEVAEVSEEDALDFTNYERVVLTKNTGEPIGLAVMTDGTVLHTARDGSVRWTDPDTGTTEVINTIDVYANSEDGLQGIALDPGLRGEQLGLPLLRPARDGG